MEDTLAPADVEARGAEEVIVEVPVAPWGADPVAAVWDILPWGEVPVGAWDILPGVVCLPWGTDRHHLPTAGDTMAVAAVALP